MRIATVLALLFAITMTFLAIGQIDVLGADLAAATTGPLQTLAYNLSNFWWLILGAILVIAMVAIATWAWSQH